MTVYKLLYIITSIVNANYEWKSVFWYILNNRKVKNALTENNRSNKFEY